MKVVIDGDGSPIIGITESICKSAGIEMVVVKNFETMLSLNWGSIVEVDKSRDRADFILVNLLKKGDLAISADYGLVAMALSKGARVLSPSGFEINNESILGHLERRHENRKDRINSRKYTKHRKRNNQDDERYIHALKSMLTSEDSEN